MARFPSKSKFATRQSFAKRWRPKATSVLLDNLSPAECGRLVSIVRNMRPSCTVEASGGINLATARAYAGSGVDFLSAGAITHSAPAADLSLLVELPKPE